MRKKKRNKGKFNVKTGRILATMTFAVVLILVADNIKRGLIKPDTKESVMIDDGRFISEENPSIPPKVTPMDEVQKPKNTADNSTSSGFESLEITSDELTKGLLVLDDAEHAVSMENTEKMIDLSAYKNEYYTVMGNNVMLNEEAAEAFNMLMTDYYEATSLKDFVVYGTTDTYVGSDSYCPRYFPERATGNTVDLALIAYGSYLAYDGLDTESWVLENCAKYGFIVRYPEEKADITGKAYCPWHLRYVGKLNASVMSSKNMCLEEYVEFIKDYNIDSPYTYRFNGTYYIIYSAKATEDTTTIKVPANGEYELSGDNIDSYIVSYER